MSQAAATADEKRKTVNSYIVEVNQAFISAGLADEAVIDMFDPVDVYQDYDDFHRVWKVIDNQMMEAAAEFGEYLADANPEDLGPNAPHVENILQYRLDDEMGNFDTLMQRALA